MSPKQLAIDRVKAIIRRRLRQRAAAFGLFGQYRRVFSAAQPGDTVLGMSLAHGGHLTHGAKVNFSGKIFNAVQYGVDENGLIDYDEVQRLATEHQPKMLIGGFSAYSQIVDWARMAEIAKSVGAYFFVDMAHVAGLVAAGVYPSPMPHADVVTSHHTQNPAWSTWRHHSRQRPTKRLKRNCSSLVFPGTQGGPLMHVIAGKAVAFKEALEPEFKDYQKQVVKNAQAMAKAIMARGYKIVSGGTENHLMLIDMIGREITGKDAEAALGQGAYHRQ